jgi:hypothetical protein
MSHILTKARDEAVRLLPAVLFFFAAFNLILLTENLTAERYGAPTYRIVGATIAALMIGKIILLVDYLPVARAFRQRPLIYPAIWRTGIYVLAAVLFVYLEHFIPLLMRHRSVSVAHQQLFLDMVWPRFSAMLIWLTFLFFLFAATQELARVVGRRELRRMFFGH